MSGARRGLSAAQLSVAFPFHIGLGRDGQIVQSGPSIQRIIPGLELGLPFEQFFALRRPNVQPKWPTLGEHTGKVIVLESLDEHQHCFRGQILSLDEEEGVLFLISPWVTNLSKLAETRLSLRDFAIHDPITDLLMLIQTTNASLQDAESLAQRLRQLNLGLERRDVDRTHLLESVSDRLAAEVEERRRVEEELMLARKLEAIGQLAAGIAHEINTPMQYLGDNTHFLKAALGRLLAWIENQEKILETASLDSATRSALASAQKDAKLDFIRSRVPEALSSMTKGIGAVNEIVVALKNYSFNGEAGTREPADLNQALQNAIVVSRNEWKHTAELETNFDPNLPPVACFLGEINQVFLNLIVNASHAIQDAKKNTGEIGLIGIETRAQNGSALISFRDNGCGIPESIRARIFDPFFTTKEVGRGTGQGLHIARSIVVGRHGGKLTFESTPGQGTTFTIALPCAKEAAP